MVPCVDAVVAVTVMCVLFLLQVLMLRECEGDSNADIGGRGGVVVVSAGHVGGTHGSCIVASVGRMSVVCRMTTLEECVGCVCVWLGTAWDDRGEWMRELGLDFTNSLGTGGVLDVYLCLGCGGVGRELVWDMGPGLQGVVVKYMSV